MVQCVVHDLWLNASERIKSLECFCSNKLVWYQMLTSTLIGHELAPCKRAGCARSGLIAIQHNINEKSFTPFGIAIFHFRLCTLGAHRERFQRTRNANSMKNLSTIMICDERHKLCIRRIPLWGCEKLHCHVRVHQLLRDNGNNINSKWSPRHNYNSTQWPN